MSLTIPAEVVEVRKEICDRCITPCADPNQEMRCSSCHLSPPKWGQYGECNAETFGLGDAIAIVANPIAKFSDAVLGTKIVGCGGCAQRRASLNALVPDISNPTGTKV